MKAADIFNVQGRVAIITGGAAGLGFAYARALADNGARVTIVDFDRKAAEAAADELSDANNSVSYEIADVISQSKLDAAFSRVVEREGRIDAVFGNVGINPGPGFLSPTGGRVREGAIDEIPMATWNRALDVNLNGMFHTVRAAVPYMKRQRHGCITLTTSTAGSMTSPAVGTPYMPTKAALAHFMRQMARELAPFGIRVNAVQPGPFQTSMTTPELAGALAPNGRIGRPEDIEGLALFFASDASSFVTGAQYPVDGGRLLGRAD